MAHNNKLQTLKSCIHVYNLHKRDRGGSSGSDNSRGSGSCCSGGGSSCGSSGSGNSIVAITTKERYLQTYIYM